MVTVRAGPGPGTGLRVGKGTGPGSGQDLSLSKSQLRDWARARTWFRGAGVGRDMSLLSGQGMD